MPGERLAVERVFESVRGDLARIIFDEGVEELPSSSACCQACAVVVR
jgi:hypothetical protein